jgi:hypothetical protein
MRISVIIRLSVALAAVVTTAATVWLLREDLRLSATLAGLKTVRGAKVSDSIIARMLDEPATDPNPRRTGAVTWTLVVITGNPCRSCGRALERWESMLAHTPPQSVRVRIVFLGESLEQVDVLARLRASGFDADSLSIDDTAAFRVVTGVRYIPMSLILAPDRSVTVAVSGTPSDTALRHSREILRDVRGGVTHQSLFEHNPDTTRISVAAEK